jgi:glycosyltransferase involved in cell wall biosynthesis
MSEPRLALCYLNYGPYHRARLVEARKSIRTFEVIGLQSTARQTEYQWDPSPAEGVVSLEQDLLPEQVSPSGWRERVSKALATLSPACCAVAGYSHPSMLAIIEWCISHDCPIVLISDSTAADAPRVKWKEWIKSQIVRACAAGFVAGTPHEEYLSQLGMPGDRIFHGCDVVDKVHFAGKAAEARAKSIDGKIHPGMPEDYFIASARFLEKKNLFRLFEAYSFYRTLATQDTSIANVPWDLVLLGDGPLRPQLERLCVSRGLTEFVHMPGFQQYDELPEYYGFAKALVHASTVEQWGLVANEAAATGKPLLISNHCGCATHLVHEGANGFTFDPYDVTDIAEKMLRITKLTPQQLSAFGAESERIVAEWGLERYATELKAAADVAIQFGNRPNRLVGALVLKALLSRKFVHSPHRNKAALAI